MPFYVFVWDDENIAHIAEHGITPEGFETVVADADVIERSRTTGRPLVFGYASDGRYLACVYELLDEITVYPITAFEVED